MKFLILGDIFGQTGLNSVVENLQTLREETKPDFIIANGENVSNNGKSLNWVDYLKLKKAGIDFFTMGNHTFRNDNILTYIDSANDIIRPGNTFLRKPGSSYKIVEIKNKKILILNLMGKGFMHVGEEILSPFKYADSILESQNYDLAIVDFHAESTSEKLCLAKYLSDRVTIFYGTHTHIQTSDERIMGNKIAYITDLGMCGVFDSAIGMNFEEIINRYIDSGNYEKFTEAKGDVRINGITVKIDNITLKPIEIKRVSRTFK